MKKPALLALAPLGLANHVRAADKATATADPTLSHDQSDFQRFEPVSAGSAPTLGVATSLLVFTDTSRFLTSLLESPNSEGDYPRPSCQPRHGVQDTR